MKKIEGGRRRFRRADKQELHKEGVVKTQRSPAPSGIIHAIQGERGGEYRNRRQALPFKTNFGPRGKER